MIKNTMLGRGQHELRDTELSRTIDTECEAQERSKCIVFRFPSFFHSNHVNTATQLIIP